MTDKTKYFVFFYSNPDRDPRYDYLKVPPVYNKYTYAYNPKHALRNLIFSKEYSKFVYKGQVYSTYNDKWLLYKQIENNNDIWDSVEGG